jgi:hypothetical protein
MPAKLTVTCLIHSIDERDSNNYIIRETIGIIRREDNTPMNIKVISFVPKNKLVPRWVSLFEAGNVLRLTGKFALDDPPHEMLEVS